MNKNFDVIFIGGGVSSTINAISLLERNPRLNIAIIERSLSFPKKVGETTSDLTAIYLNRMGIKDILDQHLVKTGLRFLFLDNYEFSSPSYKSIANGYQLDRSVFDEQLLQLAQKKGAVIFRGAKVESFNSRDFDNTVDVLYNGESFSLKSPWLIDASGRKAMSARKYGWYKKEMRLKTASSWAHFEGVDLEASWDLLKCKEWDRESIGPQKDATIHFMREHAWLWYIPLKDKTVSIGFTYDYEYYKGKPEDVFRDFLNADPVLSKVIKGCHYDKFYHLGHLPYYSSKLFKKGLALVGDAGFFVDPLFSPGLEFICQQSMYVSRLIGDYFEKKHFDEKAWQYYERLFLNAYHSRIFAYEKRYLVMDDFDIFTNWTQLDFIGYYFYHVLPSAFWKRRLRVPVNMNPIIRWIYGFFRSLYLDESFRRKRLGLKTHKLKKVTFSRVLVPRFVFLGTKYIHIFYVWFINFLRINV